MVTVRAQNPSWEARGSAAPFVHSTPRRSSDGVPFISTREPMHDRKPQDESDAGRYDRPRRVFERTDDEKRTEDALSH